MKVFSTLLLLASATFSIASNEEGVKFLAEKAQEEGVMATGSGLLYKVLRKGSGKAHPLVGTSCECHYKGTTIEGVQFDSSYDRGEPTSFAPNQVIKGWTEAMQLMVEGDKWEMYIPSELAYGARGSPPKIGPDNVLIFTMEIISINGETKPAITCNVNTLEECDDKEKAFIEKQKSKAAGSSTGHYDTEFKRLKKMNGEKMKPELKDWVIQRMGLLQRMKDEL